MFDEEALTSGCPDLSAQTRNLILKTFETHMSDVVTPDSRGWLEAGPPVSPRYTSHCLALQNPNGQGAGGRAGPGHLSVSQCTVQRGSTFGRFCFYFTQRSPPTFAMNSSKLLRKAIFCFRSSVGGVLLAVSLLKASASL